MSGRSRNSVGSTSNTRGFTLLELMVVVSILAVITAMVTPVFGATFKGIRSENEVRNLVSYLEYAQQRAVTDSAEYRVYFAPQLGVYWMERAVVRDGLSVAFVMVDDVNVEEAKLPESIALAVPRARRYRKENVYYVGFYPNGMCDDALIVLRDVDDDSAFVIATAGSRIRWEKGAA